MAKVEELVNSIEPPISLSEQQVSLAKRFVKEKMSSDSFTVQSFCKHNSISTKTWYEWNGNSDFKYYLNEISDAIIPNDEWESFQALKKHLLKIPYKVSPTPKEIDMYLNVFGYLADADRRKKMEAMGLTDERKPNTQKTVEERKASLLARLTNKQ
ncbi:phBC6A51 family helix-turn-helix protein [Niallia circulans]|uniref:Homeodomain phBC6A51-type domain-containing protein n=1 Tax=Niallia circulans TaxID=1397 RepID=A0A941G9P5_NIACI|nr:phBC6A51 family helix-turn-helix protein [Niallia circulans]MCB5235896.1 hypothetical protein [Niallia circulans]